MPSFNAAGSCSPVPCCIALCPGRCVHLPKYCRRNEQPCNGDVGATFRQAANEMQARCLKLAWTPRTSCITHVIQLLVGRSGSAPVPPSACNTSRPALHVHTVTLIPEMLSSCTSQLRVPCASRCRRCSRKAKLKITLAEHVAAAVVVSRLAW